MILTKNPFMTIPSALKPQNRYMNGRIIPVRSEQLWCLFLGLWPPFQMASHGLKIGVMLST